MTPLDERRRPKKTRGGLPRLPLFVAGLGLGYGLNGPIPHLAAGLLAGLHSPHAVLSALVSPAGMGDRRIVVMGTDHVSTNTDVMFTVQLKDGRTQLTQVPRDTFIESEKYGVMKANSLYSSGGPQMVKQELSKLLSAKVDRYLVINLGAVQRLADALGGVEVDVPKRMYYVDNSQGLYIDLYPGPQLLKGKELEGFLRFRHDELGDIGRLDRQRLLLKALFDQITKPENLVRMPAVLAAAGKDMKTDLGPMEIGGLITAMGGTKLDAERLGGRPFMRDGISYWEAEWPKASDTSAANSSSDRYGSVF